MLETFYPNLEDYYELDGRYSLTRRFWPPDTPPAGFLKRGRQSLKSGDIVTWSEHPDESSPRGWFTPAYKDKWTGIVLLTRWVWADWADGPPRRKKNRLIYPEALVLWGDNDTTNTSQSLLKRMKAQDYDKIQERRRVAYEGS